MTKKESELNHRSLNILSDLVSKNNTDAYIAYLDYDSITCDKKLNSLNLKSFTIGKGDVFKTEYLSFTWFLV